MDRGSWDGWLICMHKYLHEENWCKVNEGYKLLLLPSQWPVWKIYTESFNARQGKQCFQENFQDDISGKDSSLGTSTTTLGTKQPDLRRQLLLHFCPEANNATCMKMIHFGEDTWSHTSSKCYYSRQKSRQSSWFITPAMIWIMICKVSGDLEDRDNRKYLREIALWEKRTWCWIAVSPEARGVICFL